MSSRNKEVPKVTRDVKETTNNVPLAGSILLPFTDRTPPPDTQCNRPGKRDMVESAYTWDCCNMVLECWNEQVPEVTSALKNSYILANLKLRL